MNQAADTAFTQTFHLVGIGGIGMSAIARLLLRRGSGVSGSDVTASALLDGLSAEGARISLGHRAENIDSADVLVVSSAIASDNPERVEAQRRGIPIISRGEMLARVIGATPTVAVAGTHGKTTTTAMVAAIFEAANLDPTVAVGGERIDSATNARSGSGAWFITESDESDGSFLHLAPTIAVVTNVENDHIASDAELPQLVEQFAMFLAHLPSHGAAIIGIDNPRSAALVARSAAPVTTFATGVAHADLRAIDIDYPAFGSRFRVTVGGAVCGVVSLRLPGVINVQNALAAIGVARTAHIPFEIIARALARFSGVRRRFEVVYRSPVLTVIDDYAHHPTAVAQTIAAARAVSAGPIYVAFQPHRFTRTAYLASAFANALCAADAVFLTPIYGAAEVPIAGVSERLIGDPLVAAGVPVTYAEVDALPSVIRERAPSGTLVLMLGAGTISAAAQRLGAALKAAPVAVR